MLRKQHRRLNASWRLSRAVEGAERHGITSRCPWMLSPWSVDIGASAVGASSIASSARFFASGNSPYRAPRNCAPLDASIRTSSRAPVGEYVTPSWLPRKGSCARVLSRRAASIGPSREAGSTSSRSAPVNSVGAVEGASRRQRLRAPTWLLSMLSGTVGSRARLEIRSPSVGDQRSPRAAIRGTCGLSLSSLCRALLRRSRWRPNAARPRPPACSSAASTPSSRGLRVVAEAKAGPPAARTRMQSCGQ